MICKFVSIEEERGKYRCGFLYELCMNVMSAEGAGSGKAAERKEERKYLVDMNHEAELVDGKFLFKRQKNWDYNKWPYECTVLSVIPVSCSTLWNEANLDFIIKEVNRQYRAQEEKWKQNK